MAEPSVARGTSKGPPITLMDWAAMDEDEPGEIEDGTLVEEEEVGALHDLVGALLAHLLVSWTVTHGGLVILSDTRFGVAPGRGRKGDLSVYFKGRRPPAHALVTTPPDIMVEIVSPRPRDARRDRVDKMNEYATFGVRYYWLVDPALRSFEIYELEASGRYARAVGAAQGRIDPVPGCEGMVIDLDGIWAKAAELEEQSDS